VDTIVEERPSLCNLISERRPLMEIVQRLREMKAEDDRILIRRRSILSDRRFRSGDRRAVLSDRRCTTIPVTALGFEDRRVAQRDRRAGTRDRRYASSDAGSA
jgi:hypothetical protein